MLDIGCIRIRKKFLDYIKTHPISVFNYPFREKYVNIPVEIGFDNGSKLYYVMHRGKYKMYMARRLNTEEKSV